jgi:hypothetical protein
LGVISGDSSRVVYQDYDAEEDRILSALLDGSSAPLQISSSTRYWRVSPDRNWIVYSDFETDLFTVPVDGSSTPLDLDVSLTHEDIANSNTTWMYKVSTDSRQIVHMSLDADELTWSLYTLRFASNDAVVKLTP